jgi:hypothetical protein
MEEPRTEAFDLKKMLADYMENGLLENIIDMFKYDNSLYDYIGGLLNDERMRVRIGTAALLETLEKEDPENAKRAVPFILPLLKDQNPVVRGDAAYLLGVIGGKSVIPFLEGVIDDNDNNVRTIARESIDDIRSKSGSA